MLSTWLWWPVDKLFRLVVDMTALLRRNLTRLTSTLWRQSAIKPAPPPIQPPASSSTSNRKDYMCIDMEPVETEIPIILSPLSEELTGESKTLADTGDRTRDNDSNSTGISTLKRGFNTSTSPSTPSSTPEEDSLHSKRSRLEEKKTKKLKNQKQKSESRKMEDGQSREEDNRPNYFVACRISNPQILENIRNVQERMVARPVTSLSNCKSGHVFKETLIPVNKLHFTIHVMQLQNEEQIKTATEVLQNIFELVKENYSQNPLNIPVKGIGHFKNSVLFAKIDGDENIRRLEELSTTVRLAYESVGFIGDRKLFKPHMTIAKMSKAKKLYRKKIRSFPREIWEEDEATDFGNQNVEGIELLAMMDTDPLTKYYKCVAQFSFAAVSNTL